MIKVYSLAFWFVLIGTVFADFKKCSKNKAFDGPDNNVLLKLFTESQLEDEELKQFVCDLSEHQIVIGAAFDDQAQGLPPTIRQSLNEEYAFLKSLDQFDKPMAKLLHKLHKSISALKQSINEGITVENSELKAIKSELVQTLRLLANRWQIPADEIVPMEKKMGQESLLRELAKLWNEYKRQNWQNDHKSNEKCNYKKNKHKKRMLQLMMNLSNDGSGELADLKSAKKRQQRRRGRRKIPTIHISTTNKIAIICVLLMLVCIFNIAMFCWYNNCYDCCCCSNCCCSCNDLEIGMPMHTAELADNQGFDGSAQNPLKSTDHNLPREGLPADHIIQGTGPEAAAATPVHGKSQPHGAEGMSPPAAPALSAEHEHVPSYPPGDNMATSATTHAASETVANGGTGAALFDPPSP
uniref:Uncharacterized protein n=1 Tax=Globodera rostochiensis TaxID=31243 RepID=A0A914HTA1_GLORO